MSCHWCSYEYFDWQTRTFCKSTPDCDDCKRGDIRVCATPNVEYRPFLCRKCRDQLMQGCVWMLPCLIGQGSKLRLEMSISILVQERNLNP